MDQVHITFFNH